MTCVKLPCEKMIDLRTGRTEGFTGGNDDFAVLFSAPYRGRMDNSYDPYMGSNPCNMKVVVGIKDARNADVSLFAVLGLPRRAWPGKLRGVYFS